MQIPDEDINNILYYMIFYDYDIKSILTKYKRASKDFLMIKSFLQVTNNNKNLFLMWCFKENVLFYHAWNIILTIWFMYNWKLK